MELRLWSAVDGTRTPIDVVDPQLVVAGYTGRDQEVVRKHVAELEAEGIPPPPATPSYWVLPSWLLSTGGEVDVTGTKTSGEVEPVVIALPEGPMYVAVGSDHTDRELERVSLHASKHACPKIVSTEAWLFEDVAPEWDDLAVTSRYDDEEAPYQAGTLALLLPPEEILVGARELTDPRRPLVVFLGTVPLRDGSFRYGKTFRAELSRDGDLISCSYSVRPLGG